MKRKTNLLSLLLVLLPAATPAMAQRADNYKPDNRYVRLEQTNLPIVFINTRRTMIMKDDRITARMKIIMNGEGELNYGDTIAHPDQTVDYEGYIGLKYRGNSSFWNSDKKPYGFKTLEQPLEEGGKKQKVKIMGMGKDNDWALLAPMSDKSMIRDVLSFELARPYFEYVPQARFCELILDGTYYGVYIMTERVRKGKQRLNLDDPGTEGDELTGGYHIEIDRDDEPVFNSKYPPEDNNGGKYWGWNIHFQYKHPEDDELTSAQRPYIQRRVNDMEDALASDHYKDASTGYRKYIDVTSFIDYQLSTEFSHNVDGYRLSTNLYKKRDSEDPRFKMSLWDMNIAFGNANYHGGARTDTWVYRSNPTMHQAWESLLIPFWWNRLMTDESYVSQLKARWTEYRNANYASARIEATIDSLTTLLNAEGAQERNSRAWPRWGRYVWPNDYVAQSYDDEIRYLKEWIQKRVAWMDQQLGYDPTAVRTVSREHTNSEIDRYYNLQGQPVAVPTRGHVYIIRYKDGTTRKMLFGSSAN